MNARDKIYDIRKIHADNRLVIFVGAGVSKNSGIPMWGELVQRFAEKLNINNCENCPCENTSLCQKDQCKRKYAFTGDEYIKIPQFFYDHDDSPNKREYFKIIRDFFSGDTKPNVIDDIILNAMPHHIITTNYDKLLEMSNDINTALYTVISSDTELISCHAKNYLIKMHGDVNSIEDVVLKEKDYLSYESSHVLLCTLIKSLMIDHSFLFVGYSLSDYNLNIILEWINNLASRKAPGSDRPRNYVIDASRKTPCHINQYYESKNVYVLPGQELPQEIMDKYANVHLEYPGQITYAYLKYIFDEANDDLFVDFKSIIYEKVIPFKAYKRIFFHDLEAAYPFGKVTNYMGDLMFGRYYDYTRLASILSGDDEKALYINSTFHNAGINRLVALNSETHKYEFTQIRTDSYVFENDPIFNKYLSNNYGDIIETSNLSDNKYKEYYYEALIKEDYAKAIKQLGGIEEGLSKTNIWNDWIWVYINLYLISIMINDHQRKSTCKQKIDRILEIIPHSVKYAYAMWKRIYDDNTEMLSELRELYEEHKRIYTGDLQINGYKSEYGKLPEIQSIAYGYYFFIKSNYILIDRFANPRSVFKVYICSIFETYRRIIPKDDSPFFRSTITHYTLNRIDIDIITKYSKSDDLKSWTEDINNLDLTERFLIENFSYLCKSYNLYPNDSTVGHIHNILILFSAMNLDDDTIDSICRILFTCLSNNGIGFIDSFLDPLVTLTKIVENHRIEFLRNYLALLTKQEIFSNHYWYKARKLFCSLEKYADAEIQEAIEHILKCSEDIRIKCNLIFTMKGMFNTQQRSKWIRFLRKHLEYISIDDIFYLITEKYIRFDDMIKELFLQRVKNEVTKRENSPSVRSYPDYLQITIEYCIILHLIKGFDINPLEPHSRYSEYLSFIFYPSTFNYSGVDITNYMWCNLFASKRYRSLFLHHKDEMLTSNFESAIKENKLTSRQSYIVFKYILNRSDTRLLE